MSSSLAATAWRLTFGQLESSPTYCCVAFLHSVGMCSGDKQSFFLFFPDGMVTKCFGFISQKAFEKRRQNLEGDLLPITFKQSNQIYYCLLDQITKACDFLRGATLAVCHHLVASCLAPGCLTKFLPKRVRRKAKTCSTKRKAFIALFCFSFNLQHPR